MKDRNPLIYNIDIYIKTIKWTQYLSKHILLITILEKLNYKIRITQKKDTQLHDNDEC